MKAIILTGLIFIFSMSNVNAENAEKDYTQIERLVSVLQQSNVHLNANVEELTRQNSSLRKDIGSLQIKAKEQAQALKKITSEQKSNIKKLDEQIVKANGSVEQNASILGQRTIWGIVFLFLLLALICIAVYLLRKSITKGSYTIYEVKSAQEKLQNTQTKLQEESIKLDDKLLEVLNKQMPNITTPQEGVEPDHSLAKKVADEIVCIETNLSRMDASVKGHKQLSKAVERIKDNFKANGYEIIDMIGKPYVQGMKVIATFVTDESLEQGQQIITRVIKPQINFRQQMIQAAQIEVSQPE